MSRLPVKFTNEPVVEVDDEGNHVPFIPVQIQENRQAYAASLNIIFKHVAEFHLVVLTVIAEKYNLNVGEILDEIHKDERYSRMNGIINTLGVLDETDATRFNEIQENIYSPQVMPEEQVSSLPEKKKLVKKRTPPSETKDIEKSMEDLNIATETPKKRIYKKKTAGN